MRVFQAYNRGIYYEWRFSTFGLETRNPEGDFYLDGSYNNRSGWTEDKLTESGWQYYGGWIPPELELDEGI